MLSHVVLHATLCNSALRLKQQAPMEIRVRVSDSANRNTVEQTFTVVREHAGTATVAWDMPWGLYRLDVQLQAPRVSCSASEFFAVVTDHNRNIALTLQEGKARAAIPVLIYGAAPFSFAYAQPTVVLFDGRAAKCNAAVPDPVGSDYTQNDADGYYATIFPTPALLQHMPLVPTVRLTDSRGNYHYIKVANNFITFSSGWPSAGTLNVNEDEMDYIADKPEDTLLCPKMYETITH